MQKRKLSVNIPEGLKLSLLQAGQKCNRTLSEEVTTRLAAPSIDPCLMEAIERIAENCGVEDLDEFVSVLLAGVLGQLTAALEVYGSDHSTFADYANPAYENFERPIGISLLDWYQWKIDQSREWFQEVFEREQLESLLDQERHNPDVLTDKERTFLVRHRAGRTWLESPEYAQEQREAAEVERVRRELRQPPIISGIHRLPESLRRDLFKRYQSGDFGERGSDAADIQYRSAVNELLVTPPQQLNHDA